MPNAMHNRDTLAPGVQRESYLHDPRISLLVERYLHQAVSWYCRPAQGHDDQNRWLWKILAFGMAHLILPEIRGNSVAERLEQKRMPTDFFPMPHRTAMPLVAIVKHVLEFSVNGNGSIRSESVGEVEAVLDIFANLFTAPLAKVEHSVLCATTPFVPVP